MKCNHHFQIWSFKMADKKIKKTVAEEFRSSFGVNASIPDPVAVGDAHVARAADQSTDPTGGEPTAYAGQPGSEQPTRNEMLAHLFDNLAGTDPVQLQGMYSDFCKLGGFGADAHTGRAADQSTSEKIATSYGNVKEDVETVLKNTNLDEATIARASTLFEAAVKNRVLTLQVEVEKIFEEKFSEAITEKLAELDEANANYMDYVAKEWMEENKVAVEHNMRTELAESFLAGLKELFEKHYIDIPEDKVDVVKELAEEVETLRTQLDEAKAQLIEQQTAIDAENAQRQQVVEEVSKDLTESQKERLSMLSESIDFSNPEEFKTILETVVEDFIKTTVKPVDATELLNEEVILDEGKVQDDTIDPQMAALARDVGRLGKA